ncbi:methyltransferase domain containing protein, putative [Trypanosoma equiperdum]|uniref:Methyltransferase domain-containing protein n=4 Tax=Trypanozoon TaxID=39700 RepID=Q38EP1_TRYB2|nr:hypothetical protein, conserved [Trypanosoma brucei gambiense DAL972]XP_827059.1 hypothetical protein, conserved [Trypanosoma brucei brucei TREU927]RHW69981.1 methyltransferase domain containing protein [Trypanosoma brucei equiperdum]SCU64951.1 methyltransferase domain containing protein, putative [Trypanosoma equiperdum]EAN76729.1 hypothetical protein, conserved [Trypanosoma brucei brucei TREU927]CBH14296.1 hypothetical protein, conserved [Trypanosoma brucei gambiense DAL972]|eukprot:XP_011776566.1 hypothetical protein, conserved [Trypanosoma brucei gambiense DAL972]
MEPKSVEEYSQQNYWIGRYEVEEQHDWFLSVRQPTIAALCDELLKVFQQRERLHSADGNVEGDQPALRVLHLGTGNSSLCMDLYEAVRERQLPFALHQVAMDYAPNVIERMQSKYSPDILPNAQWIVGDVRKLEEFREYGPFDAVIEKGTMDAIEADKNRPEMKGDVEAMLHGVDTLLKHAKGYGAFLQVTWVAPHLRLPYTKGDAFAWGDQVRYSLLGESDIYRLFVYTVRE